MLPNIEACLVCELVRPEPAGKLAVLGFYGICPNVDIRLGDLDQPAILTFVFTGSGGDGTARITIDVVDESDGRIIAATGEFPLDARSGSSPTVISTLVLIFGRAGPFAARCLMDGVEQYRGRFTINQGPPAPTAA